MASRVDVIPQSKSSRRPAGASMVRASAGRPRPGFGRRPSVVRTFALISFSTALVTVVRASPVQLTRSALLVATPDATSLAIVETVTSPVMGSWATGICNRGLGRLSLAIFPPYIC